MGDIGKPAFNGRADLAAVGCIVLGEPMAGDQAVEQRAIVLDPCHPCAEPHAPLVAPPVLVATLAAAVLAGWTSVHHSAPRRRGHSGHQNVP